MSEDFDKLVAEMFDECARNRSIELILAAKSGGYSREALRVIDHDGQLSSSLNLEDGKLLTLATEVLETTVRNQYGEDITKGYNAARRVKYFLATIGTVIAGIAAAIVVNNAYKNLPTVRANIVNNSADQLMRIDAEMKILMKEGSLTKSSVRNIGRRSAPVSMFNKTPADMDRVAGAKEALKNIEQAVHTTKDQLGESHLVGDINKAAANKKMLAGLLKLSKRAEGIGKTMVKALNGD